MFIILGLSKENLVKNMYGTVDSVKSVLFKFEYNFGDKKRYK